MRFSIILILVLLMSLVSVSAQSQIKKGKVMGALSEASREDSIKVNVFSFDDPSPEGWSKPYRGKATFPIEGASYRKILMLQHLKCDPRTKHDTLPCGEWDYHTQYLIMVPKGDTLETMELASFITPYGIRLEMGGENGWMWVYDVTDYAPLLQGEREIIAGNNQELLDLSFIFIKGTPPRTTLACENLYPTGHYKYWKLADDSVLQAKKRLLMPEASAYALKARISGHGHNGPRNCCEWDRKSHSYLINDEVIFRWEVWKDCGFNPIYPQGGTWPFDRAGWCPGTPVDEYVFELTPSVVPGDSVKIDYSIEQYTDNGEKEGEFRMSHQLFSYGPPNFEVDAEVYDIISPGTADVYSRINPSCGRVKIILRNAGESVLKTVEIKYGIMGGPEYTYKWLGELIFLEKEEIVMPFNNIHQYTGKYFFVQILEANGAKDENEVNNFYKSSIPKYPILDNEVVISYHSNNLGRAAENALILTDSEGRILLVADNFKDDSLYLFPLTLADGCYELRLTDKMQDGIMKHWWYRRSQPEKVGINGQLEIKKPNGELLKSFPPDFGQEILFRFVIE